eukprot:jgi/Mesen1/9118/ME000058S08612
MVLLEATDCMAACNAPSAADVATVDRLAAPVYELRTYELEAGYHAVADLRRHFREGLPSRVEADGCGQCMFLGYSEVGRLNVFIEIWRHSSTVACLRARQGARQAQKWRDTIAAVAPLAQTFRTELLRPADFSPWH